MIVSARFIQHNTPILKNLKTTRWQPPCPNIATSSSSPLFPFVPITTTTVIAAATTIIAMSAIGVPYSFLTMTNMSSLYWTTKRPGIGGNIPRGTR